MVQHPILMNRPIVVTPLGTRLCRPSEAVLDILPSPQLAPFAKEDGEPVIVTLRPLGLPSDGLHALITESLGWCTFSRRTPRRLLKWGATPWGARATPVSGYLAPSMPYRPAPVMPTGCRGGWPRPPGWPGA